ncbi:hypothetical protein [Streptomyces europaeiscabiei]|uniref:hypothetical protein n=1 Tax=Streptomyces europaeiscabiei TaxID=146819 RepID=UPI0038F69ECE
MLGFLSERETTTRRQTVHVLANEVVTGQEDGSDDKRVELQHMVLLHVRQSPPEWRNR